MKTRTMTRTKMNKLQDVARYKVLRQHHDSHYVIASCTSLHEAHAIAENDARSFVGLVNESSPVYIQVWQLYDGKWECIEQFTVKGVHGPIFEYLPD